MRSSPASFFGPGRRSDWLIGLAVAHDLAGCAKDVDGRAGSIRACGHLTARAADLLSRAVLDRHDRGQRRIVLDLTEVEGAEDASFLMLQQLQTVVTAEGGTLVVLHPAARWW